MISENNYEQIKKNTVAATNQLKDSEDVTFENVDGKGVRVMFVGNSITLHGIKHEIGWHNRCGMAASSKEKDYVHQLIAKIDEVKEDAAYCICQVASWESKYQEGIEKLSHIYESAREFEADIIVLRLIENCPMGGFDGTVFKKELEKLIAFLDASGKAKFVITTSFWRHCGDEAIREFAGEHQMPLVELGDLGALDEMKAIGKFEHEGVANHPGDLGMEKIAERIFDKMKIYL